NNLAQCASAGNPIATKKSPVGATRSLDDKRSNRLGIHLNRHLPIGAQRIGQLHLPPRPAFQARQRIRKAPWNTKPPASCRCLCVPPWLQPSIGSRTPPSYLPSDVRMIYFSQSNHYSYGSK